MADFSVSNSYGEEGLTMGVVPVLFAFGNDE